MCHRRGIDESRATPGLVARAESAPVEPGAQGIPLWYGR